MRYYRPTWAEIKLDNLGYNLRQIRKILSARVKIMACVKADAYGHGLVAVAKELASCKIDYLGAASIDEGIKLRQAGIKLPILVLGLILKKDIAPLFTHNLTSTVCSDEFIFFLNAAAAKRGRPVKVHIKVDTGMGRLGILYKDAIKFIKRAGKLKFIRIEGISTHFPCADMNKDFTLYQTELFERLITGLAEEGIRMPLVHAANSMGLIGYKESHFNMVRPGLAIYGLYPKEGLDINLKPVLSLKTRVIYFKKVPRGWGVSYGHTYVTKKDTTVVTLPIGYGDGYPRNLSNVASVLIRGERFKISGRVCMDQIMVDVGNLPVKTGDEAVLIGSQGKNKITAEELAVQSGTIPYEIVCGLGSRIPRVYI